MALYLTHACDVLYTLCSSIREIDIWLFCHWVTELRLSISVSKTAFLITWETFTGINRRGKARKDIITKWE